MFFGFNLLIIPFPQIRPEAATTSKELDYPAKEQPPDTQTDNNNQAPTGDDDVSEDEKVKPDFGQSDSGDADPNEGAINLGFDDDEAQKEEKKKEEVWNHLFILTLKVDCCGISDTVICCVLWLAFQAKAAPYNTVSVDESFAVG